MYLMDCRSDGNVAIEVLAIKREVNFLKVDFSETHQALNEKEVKF